MSKRDIYQTLRFRWAYCQLYNMRINFSEFARRLHMSEDAAMDLLTVYRRQVVNGERPDPRDKLGWRWH